MIHAVTVYCSSGRDVGRVYFDAAAEMGTAIAREGWELVYGGNDCGCMGALADAARAAGGRVVGVTPQVLHTQGVTDHKCHELVITPGMRERKALLEQRGDAFITLPGGLGTLEEIFEIIVGRSLGFHAKPIVLVNVVNFFAPLLAMLDRGIEQNFIKAKSRRLFHVSPSVADAIAHLKQGARPSAAPDPSAAE
ncbi:MAG: hypothetical protein JWN24_538 [Phycisphaerales bacterium]|nr:hypothetical protein [Phycisphaerales bacterium]